MPTARVPPLRRLQPLQQHANALAWEGNNAVWFWNRRRFFMHCFISRIHLILQMLEIDNLKLQTSAARSF